MDFMMTAAQVPLQFPFAFEMVAVPLDDHILKEDTNRSSILITGVNYSVSPKSNKFAGQYHWYDEETGILQGRVKTFRVF